MVNFTHSLLGAIIGVQYSSLITQFRSIPYATYPQRWRQSTLKTTLGPTERNFTDYGYICPQAPIADPTGGGYVAPVTGPDWYKTDEFKCLAVTVSAPTKYLPAPGKKSGKLPVLVYLHGGGFVSVAGASDPSHDCRNIAEQAAEDGSPVITVGLQYRLSWQGFMASQDIVNEASANGEPPGNFGLFDQRNALLWIKKFIGGFGGDPDNITVFGESAGSISIHSHMISNQTSLFHRAIMMSGAQAGLQAMPLNVAERGYDALLGALNISATDPDRLAKLRAVPWETLVSLIPLGSFVPLADTTFFPTIPTFNNVANLTKACSWVNELIIGNTKFEGYNGPSIIDQATPDLMIYLFQTLFGPTYGLQVANAYNITSGMDMNLFHTFGRQFYGDLILTIPQDHLIKGIADSKKVYRYWYDVRNPFPDHSMYQIAHHWVDVYYVFRNHRFRMPTDEDKAMSDAHARKWVSFAYGKTPWTRFDMNSQTTAVANIWNEWTTRSRAADERIANRRYKAMEVFEQVYAATWGDAYLDITGILAQISGM